MRRAWIGWLMLLWAVSAHALRYRVEADLEGVLFLMKGAGAEVRWTGVAPVQTMRGDTLVLRFVAFRPAPLWFLGAVSDTVTLRVPEGAEVDLVMKVHRGWADLDLTGLRVGALQGQVGQGRLFLRWKGESTCGPLALEVRWGTVELSGLGWCSPPMAALTAAFARVRLNLFRPPRRKVPLLISGNFTELRLRTGDVPFTLRREGFLQLGAEAHRPGGSGFDILFTGALSRVVWEP